jgi:hypothetical protein
MKQNFATRILVWENVDTNINIEIDTDTGKFQKQV